MNKISKFDFASVWYKNVWEIVSIIVNEKKTSRNLVQGARALTWTWLILGSISGSTLGYLSVSGIIPFAQSHLVLGTAGCGPWAIEQKMKTTRNEILLYSL